MAQQFVVGTRNTAPREHLVIGFAQQIGRLGGMQALDAPRSLDLGGFNLGGLNLGHAFA